MSKENLVRKEQSKKKQFIIFGLCSFIALVLCMVTLVITVKQVEGDNSHKNEEAAVKESATVLKNDFSTLSDYALRLTKDTHDNNFVKVNSYTDVSVDDETVRLYDKAGNEVNNGLILYAKNKLMPAIDGWYGEDYTGEFGSIRDDMPVVSLSGVKATTARYTTGLADEDGKPVYDDNGVLVDGDYYYLTFKTEVERVAEKGVSATYRGTDAPKIGTMLKKELDSACSITKSEVEPAEFTVTLKINRLTDEITYLEIERLYNVKADVKFIGNMSIFGEKSVEFTYKVTEHFDYYYAGISFTNEPLHLSVGEEGVVSVNAVIENDSDYTVKFFSSDESIAAVDEMGYVTALKASDKPVYINVTLCYMGHVFADQCPVYVDNEAE